MAQKIALKGAEKKDAALIKRTLIRKHQKMLPFSSLSKEKSKGKLKHKADSFSPTTETLSKRKQMEIPSLVHQVHATDTMIPQKFPSETKPNLMTSSSVKNAYSQLGNEKHPFATKELFNIIFGLKQNQLQQGVTMNKSLKTNLLDFSFRKKHANVNINQLLVIKPTILLFGSLVICP